MINSYNKKINNDLIKKIISLYNLEVKEVKKSNSGYRNTSYPILTRDNRLFNLIFYKNESDILQKIKNANLVSDSLSNLDFPTRKTYQINNKSILKIYSNNKEYFCCLYNYLEGETIPWEAYTSKHIKLLGGMMGKMHLCMKDLNAGSLSSAVDENISLNKRMQQYFSQGDVQQAIKNKLGLKTLFNFEKYSKVFELVKNFDSQVLHLDFVRGNILFKKETELIISGVLDFEKTSYGPKILDIARTLAFLIIDCKYKSEDKIRKYFLFNGYQKRGENNLPDLSLLEDLLNFYWIHDFYKFLKHNPYEFLSQNEHYCRTKNQLLSAQLLLLR